MQKRKKKVLKDYLENVITVEKWGSGDSNKAKNSFDENDDNLLLCALIKNGHEKKK